MKWLRRLRARIRARGMTRKRKTIVGFKDRRLFLKLTGIAMMSACLSACITSSKKLQELAKWEKNNSVYTSNRKYEGIQFSVKREIENTPLIKEREMFWIKLKGNPGTIYRNASIREEHYVIPEIEHPDASSVIHTRHMDSNTPEQYKTLFKKIRSTIPYPDFAGRKGNRFIRNRHVGVIGEDGKLEGYVTLHFTKKWAEKFEQGKLEKEYKKIEEANEKIQKLMDMEKYDLIEPIIDQYQHELKKLEKEGVRIRVTPMPGYIFKKGYFQKK